MLLLNMRNNMEIDHNITLLGEENSERAVYFLKAASEMGAPVSFVQLPSFEKDDRFDFSVLKNCIVKIDPPDFKTAYLDMLNPIMERYLDFLTTIEKLKNIKTLNTPSALVQTLDKFACKQALLAAGLSTTQLVTVSQKEAGSISDLSSLR